MLIDTEFQNCQITNNYSLYPLSRSFIFVVRLKTILFHDVFDKHVKMCIVISYDTNAISTNRLKTTKMS